MSYRPVCTTIPSLANLSEILCKILYSLHASLPISTASQKLHHRTPIKQCFTRMWLENNISITSSLVTFPLFNIQYMARVDGDYIFMMT